MGRTQTGDFGAQDFENGEVRDEKIRDLCTPCHVLMGTLKSRRMCSGHAVHMGGKRNSCIVLGGRSEGKRSFGRSNVDGTY